ncbi:MAG: DUF4097 family beta strand repeat-containing protein [Bacillota bacterium]
MNHKVGRVTLAVALIAVGAALVYDNITGTALAWSLFRLWPALLIMLGLEWIVAAAKPGSRVHADGGAVALLIVGLIMLGALTTVVRTTNSVRWAIDSRPPVMPAVGTTVSSDEVTSTYPLDGETLPHLIVSGGSASVMVVPGEKAQIQLGVKALGRSHAEATDNASRALLDIEKGAATRVGLNLPPGINYAMLTLRITVPEPVKLSINTSSGYVEVIDRQADVAAASSSGAIKVENVAGLVDLRSSSGTIAARRITGSVSAISSSGAVRIEGVSGDVEASATSGAVYVIDAGGKVGAQTSSGRVGVETREVGGDYDLGTVSGSIHFAFPRTASLTLDARTSSGSIHGPRWLTYGEGRGSAAGSQGEGTYKAMIRTTSGSIYLADQ